MGKSKVFVIAVVLVGLLGGCSKFSPDETAVSVGKDGDITAAILDVLDESYYSADELTNEVEGSVSAYNSGAGAENISIDKFEIKEGDIELFMKYVSYSDYREFNNIDFYVGDITNGYNQEGYRFETTFSAVDNGEVTNSEVTREEIFAGMNHSLLVFNEDMEVTVPGKILYISNNLELTGKKSARRGDDEGTVTESESETETETKSAGSGLQELEPVLEGVVAGDTVDAEASKLAYIIYE